MLKNGCLRVCGNSATDKRVQANEIAMILRNKESVGHLRMRARMEPSVIPRRGIDGEVRAEGLACSLKLGVLEGPRPISDKKHVDYYKCSMRARARKYQLTLTECFPKVLRSLRTRE